MQNTVLKTNRQFNLFSPNSTVIVGVSGGADSISLLHILVKLRSAFQINLHVATLNHGLRDDAAGDVLYVKNLANELQIPITAETIDVAQQSQLHGIGIEAAGRKARYDFFARVAEQSNATHIATAHHADDNAETIFMHILRGTGIQGLKGMQAKSPMPDHPSLTLIRPLLHVRRSEIEDYCEKHQLSPRQDATNTNTVFLRNAIRHSILPRLREENPQIDAVLNQLADIVSVEDDFMQAFYDKNIVPHSQTDSATGRSFVQRDIFLDWHPAMQRRWITNVAGKLRAEASYKHILSAVDIAQNSSIGTVAQLTNGVQLRIGYNKIILEHEDTPLPEEDYLLIDSEITVFNSGEIDCGSWSLATENQNSKSTIAKLQIKSTDKITLRTRQTGDKFEPLGMDGHSKTLKRWMIDRKIPAHLRNRIPILTVNNQIAAIILLDEWVIDQKFAITESTQDVIYFSIQLPEQ